MLIISYFCDLVGVCSNPDVHVRLMLRPAAALVMLTDAAGGCWKPTGGPGFALLAPGSWPGDKEKQLLDGKQGL